jgi:hypothetical protein
VAAPEAPPPEPKRTPGTPAGVRELPEIPIIEFDAVRFQHSKVFIFERPRSMVFLLISDVPSHSRTVGSADRERSVPFLPVEAAFTNYIVNPRRRTLLEISKDIGDTVRRFQSCQQVHVVGHASHLKSDSSEVTHGTTENRVKPRAPVEIDDRQAIFRRKDNVVMKAHVGRWHRHFSFDLMVPRPPQIRSNVYAT